MKLTVRYGNKEKTEEFAERVLLWEALNKMGFYVGRPCGGRGVCGNCRVTANGESVRACITPLEEDTLVEDLPLEGELQLATGAPATVEGWQGQIKEGYGLAVDIGTTTIAGYLYKFPEGELVKEVGVANPQIKYGADVVTRMEYALKGGAESLRECIWEQIRTLAGDVKVEKYVICGNTVMLHFLSGKSVAGMACAPYKPESLFGEWQGDLYFAGCISAFIGGDVVCAVLYSEMWKQRVSLLVDIGTNGEMVLYKDGRYICCSAAAGPALEGAEISMGMTAQAGAIDKVYVENGGVKYTTIGNVRPRGICGSGLLDAVAVMLRLGFLDETGYLEEAYEIGDSGVLITPEDVRQVQLAKGAIRAGLETLLYESGCNYEEVERIYIAGGFGNYLDKENAAVVGMIPHELLEKVTVLGNGAGKGACLLLQSDVHMEMARNITEHAVTLQLADSAYFGEKYVEHMMFE